MDRVLDEVRWRYISAIASMVCITVISIVYFVTIKQDGTIFSIVSSVLSMIIGYIFGASRSRGEKNVD